MPIRQRAPRTSDQIYRGLTTGHVRPSSISILEARGLRLHCLKVVERNQQKAQCEFRRNRLKIARRYQRELWAGLAARLSAAWKAYGRADARARRHSQPVSERRFEQVWTLAERLKRPDAPAAAFRTTKQKPNGGWRHIYRSNVFGIAKDQLLRDAVKPFASFHPSQFMQQRRGRSAACENLLQAMNGVLPGSTRFIQFDVNDCFSSFNRNWLREFLRPVPKAVIDSTLFMAGWTIISKGRDTMMGQRGLLQGLASSSLIAEMVLADVLTRAADPLEQFTTVSRIRTMSEA